MPLDLGWQNHAACKGQDTVLFFGTENERGETKDTRITEAKTFCAVCPVIGECGDFALDPDRPQKSGIWGGMDEDERKKEHRTRLRRTLSERRAVA